MPIIVVQVKPEPGDVAHVIAVTEAGSHAKEKAEPVKQELEVHEGVPDTFTFDLQDDQRLILEATVAGKLVHDLAQGHVTKVMKEPAAAPKTTTSHSAAAAKKKDAA